MWFSPDYEGIEVSCLVPRGPPPRGFSPDYEGIEATSSLIESPKSIGFLPTMRELKILHIVYSYVRKIKFSPDYEGIEVILELATL